MPGGADHLRHQIELAQTRFVHPEHPLPCGAEADLPLPDIVRRVDAVAGHVFAEGFSHLVFMNPVRGNGLVFHIDGIAPHELKTAQIAPADGLTGDHGRAFGHARLNARHVVQGHPAHGLAHGNARQIRPGEGKPRTSEIRRLSPAGTAYRAEHARMRLAADGAAHDASPIRAAHVFSLHRDGLGGENGNARLVNFLLQQIAVLLLLGRGLHIPCADGRPGIEPVQIKTHAHALARALVIQAHGVQAEIENSHPAVADGAGRKQLNGIRQAVGCLADGVVQHPAGHMAFGQLHHVRSDDEAGRGIAVELARHFHKFLMCPLAQTHICSPSVLALTPSGRAGKQRHGMLCHAPAR